MLKKNIFSIVVALIIMYLSLISSNTFDKVSFSRIAHFDKFVHFLMYFCLTSVILFDNRRNIKSTKHLFLISLIPFMYGILIEILQSTLTITRTGSYFDAIFNTIGIIASLLISIWIKPLLKKPSNGN
jgi:VanZ family protein